MNIRHTLFTRLNVSYWKLPDAGAWMQQRFRLFMQYTVPSVRAQTDRDFIWFVVVDPKTPPKYMKKLKALEVEGLVTLLVTNTGMRGSFETLAAGDNDAIHRVTTRLDSDDVLHPKFMETIVGSITSKHAVINLNYGAVWEHEKRARVIKHSRNMFVARVCQPGDPFKSVIEYQHGELCSRYPTRQVLTASPMWVILVHNRNTANSTRIAKGMGIGDYMQISDIAQVLRMPVKQQAAP